MGDVTDSTTVVMTDQGNVPIFVATPDGAPGGAVIVLQEVFGVNEHIRDVTRRFATAGFVGFAPHLFHRTGDPELGYTGGEFGPHMLPLDDAAVTSDIGAAIDAARAAGFADHQIGVVGFCFGGRAAFLAALTWDLGAAVTFYGGGIASPGHFPVPSLIDRAGALRTPWLGLFGDLDKSIPAADVERLRATVRTSPVETDITRYPDADHGFHCDARASYHEPSSKAAFARAVGWFSAHLA
jgi:carboxymethylenebutenolidase